MVFQFCRSCFLQCFYVRVCAWFKLRRKIGYLCWGKMSAEESGERSIVKHEKEEGGNSSERPWPNWEDFEDPQAPKRRRRGPPPPWLAARGPWIPCNACHEFTHVNKHYWIAKGGYMPNEGWCVHCTAQVPGPGPIGPRARSSR